MCNIYNNIETIFIEFEQLIKNEYFTIEQKNSNVLSLFIIFQIDLLDKKEILLPLNEIKEEEKRREEKSEEKIKIIKGRRREFKLIRIKMALFIGKICQEKLRKNQ